MRGLAGYAMRGRREALLVAVIAAVVPMFFWVSASVVGLVTLRRGAREGALLTLWALLPCLVLAWYGEIMPAAALAGMWVVAWVLRSTVSWRWTLLAVAAMGLLLGALLLTAGSAYLAEAEKIVADFFARLTEQADPATKAALQVPGAVQIAGIFGFMHALTLLGCTAIARWWQAMLYNPGGFRVEFHAISLGPTLAAGLAIAGIVCLQAGQATEVWAWTVWLPLLAAGTSLVHGLVAARGRGGAGWLGFYYASLLLLPWVKYGVVILAVLDGFMDLRSRLAGKPPAAGND
jgi:hypothetical protein